MAYGEQMKKLSPCGDRTVLETLRSACPEMKTLLDAGCGRGDRLAAIGAAMPAIQRAGIELDPENAAAARAGCPGAEIVEGDVCALPWADGQFDAALCECTLSLLDAPEACLAELRRVLRPGGILLLSDLISGGETLQRELLSPTGAVRYLASRPWTEQAFAAAGFRVLRYVDCREDYLTMAAQMIFDGGCGCVSPAAFAALRAKKASYGMWILERSGAVMEKDRAKIGAVVAAAGLSSRMGAFKPLLPFDGMTVIERCIANLRAADAETIAVVTGHRGAELERRLRSQNLILVRNADYAATQMFDSLRLGLRALPGDCGTILLTPGDVPLVKTETVRALTAAAAGGFACPVCAGRRGHPVALDAVYRDALLAWNGEGGLRGAVAALGIPVTEVEVSDAGMSHDLDTPADYEAVLSLLEKGKA